MLRVAFYFTSFTIIFQVHKVMRVANNWDCRWSRNQIAHFSLASRHLPEMDKGQSDNNGDKGDQQWGCEG